MGSYVEGIDVVEVEGDGGSTVATLFSCKLLENLFMLSKRSKSEYSI